MKLNSLPNELIQAITQYLPIKYVAALCLTSKSSYQIFLPTLYKHIILGHRLHLKQLEQGLSRNIFLKKTASQCTQQLTLKCQQGGSDHRWRLILKQLPNVRHLNLRDYMELSVQKIQHMLSTLPNLIRLDIRYCNLTDVSAATLTFENITDLQLIWTDFSLEAIQKLFESLPNLNQVLLGANHNRRPTENDAALGLLQRSCLQVSRLSVSLQQVNEATLCAVLCHYGLQLKQLSLRCEGDQIIRAISQYAHRLQSLVIRHSGCNLNDVSNILRECDSLNHFELVSWPERQVPSVVLERMRYQKQVGVLKTFALGKNDLQEIRRLRAYNK
ncbi:hypothetical protein G6F56_010027 [Rhizopus delemar]|nr:hypothetical protein G6F56_010027 [Rhizopus delemar]